MPRLRLRGSLLSGVLVLVCLAIGVRAQAPAPMHQDIDPGSIKWEPAPPGMPAGAMVAVLFGDPSKEGEYYVMRLKAPDGYKVMPHTHPSDEHLTILKGTFLVGMGEKWDAAALKSLGVDGHSYMPKNTAHFATVKGETIIEASGVGPFGITYINPNDDPRGKKTSNP